MDQKWLSVGEAAVYLGVHPKTVSAWIRQKKLNASRLSRKLVRLDIAELNDFIQSGMMVFPDDDTEVPVKPEAAEGVEFDEDGPVFQRTDDEGYTGDEPIGD